MRSCANSGFWMFLAVIIGLAVTCVNGRLLGILESTLAPLAPSENRLLLAAMISGNFSNEEQIQKQKDRGQPGGPYIGAMFVPVPITIAGSDTTFYMEQTVNGKVIKRHLIALQENGDGGIRLRVYNLTQSLPSSPLYELENVLNFLERNGDQCDAVFYPIEGNMTFFGTWPICESYSPKGDKYRPFWIMCSGLYLQSPSGISGGRPVPSQFKPNMRYPLLFHSNEQLYWDYCRKDN